MRQTRRSFYFLRNVCCAVLFFLGQSTSFAQVSPGAGEVNFARDVLPILSNKCFVCHGPDAEADMLKLDTFESATADRDGHRAVQPDKASESELLKRIHSQDDPMPPADAEQQLTQTERETLSNWVEQGGAYKQHWAFVVPTKVVPPSAIMRDRNPALASDIIDGFVQQQLHQRGLDFAPVAERTVLARRVALTLTGLPPEPEQLESFLTDNEPGAYARYVDTILSSPRFGEHQARYWLDAVRYGDTHGLHLDNRRGIFPYRDWVILALNNGLPWDQFITWQLAGDLLPNPTLEQLVATGYVRMNPSTSEGGAIPEEFQAKNNFDRTETLGTVFLGLTLTCARCHTHKYDPISHSDYFRLFAFFNSTQESPMDGNKYDYAPTVKAPSSIDGWHKWSEVQQQRTESLAESKVRLDKLKSELEKTLDSWPADSADQAESLVSQLQKPLSEVQDQLKKLDDFQAQYTTTLVASELAEPRTTFVLHRGEYDQPTGEAVTAGVPAVLNPFPAAASANRLGLAKWLTSRENPLVSRVLVNRLWQQIFGHALVRTPEDFGLQGQQPTHPELLDWLAVELQDSGWDHKHILRSMLLSQTFRQNSSWRTDVDDPENRLFARGPSYRLDAEVLRDIGLWASGTLDPQMGGEGVKPYQPEGMWEALAHPASNTKSYQPDSGQRLYRRSIYVYWKRTSPHPMMTLFDAPSRESSCVRRSRTNTSLQSLGLLNETQRVEVARKLAERLLVVAESDEERCNKLFQWLACRKPTDAERQLCQQLLQTMRARFAQAPQDANDLLATGEAPRASQLKAIEVAAWTQVTTTVLASDLSIMLY